MPIDLYGAKPIGITQDVAQRAIQAKAPAQPTGAFSSSMKYYSQKLGEAINAWGMDTVMDWRNKGALMEKQFRDDLEEMRRKAQMARTTNDMELYAISMQRILFDKQMLAYAGQIKKNNTHSLIAGLVEAIGQIGGGVAGKYVGKKKEEKEKKEYLAWLENFMNEFFMKRTGPRG